MCSKIGTIVKQFGGKLKVMKLSCRSWSCEDCAKGRKRKLIGEVREGIPERFITLTVNPAWFDSPEDRARRLVAAWRLIRRRFLKRWPNLTCEFMAIFEKTQLGEPHLHIVQKGGYIPQRWLSQQMEQIMGAPVVDIRYVKNKGKIAWYVSKYVGKEPHQFGTLKRYWRSLKYLAITRKEKRRLANSGATFYILDVHWKAYMRWAMSKFSSHALVPGRGGFELEWPDDKVPPWCLTETPIVCP